MIQKGTPIMRRPSMRSQSPSVRSTSSFSNLRKGRIRSGSLSASSSRSSSPIRSISSSSDQLLPPPNYTRIKRHDSFNSSRKQEPYSGIISVVIRLKPNGGGGGERDPWYVKDESTMQNADYGEFKYDHVFKIRCNNVEVYAQTSKPMIDRVLEGLNATVFAYGMTGSGKTFTMTGTDEELGLIPLSVAYLYSRVMEESLQGESRFEIAVSYLEIYNEKIYDLLDCENDSKLMTATSSRMFAHVGGRSPKTPIELKLREDSKYGVKIVGLTERRCESSDELLKWIRIGDKSRKTGETTYNTRSSRSHAIVMIRLTKTDLKEGTSVSSTLSLCDLAGSEKAVTHNERRKEGAFINKSLLALGTVISKLSAESTSHRNGTSSPVTSHIPYRDSKLTRILQPALSGNGVVTTICTIDTRPDASSETLNTLRFASRAKNVSLHIFRKPLLPSMNGNNGISEEKDRTIVSLTRQLEEQQTLISKLKDGIESLPSLSGGSIDVDSSRSSTDPSTNLVETENKFLKYKLEHCEKLLDKDTIDLQDSEIAEIVDILPVEVGTLLETKFQGMESQLRQYKEYARTLEDKLAEFERQVQTPQSSGMSLVSSNTGDSGSVVEFRKSLERKDKMIEALQSALRLRERALKPINKEEVEVSVKEEFY